MSEQNTLPAIITNPNLTPQQRGSMSQVVEKVTPIIEEWKKKAYELVVTDVSQKKLAKLAYEGSVFLKKHRVGIENLRKEMKAPVIEQGRAIDAFAAYLTSQIEPLEEHLKKQENFFEQEKARIRQELIDSRKAELQPYLAVVNPDILDLGSMSDDSFNAVVEDCKVRLEEKIAADKMAEEEKLELQRKLDEERKKNEELENSKKEAERLAREAEEKAKHDALMLRMAPDKEKLQHILGLYPDPAKNDLVMESPEASEILAQFHKKITAAKKYLAAEIDKIQPPVNTQSDENTTEVTTEQTDGPF